jgi:hypothetical protein
MLSDAVEQEGTGSFPSLVSWGQGMSLWDSRTQGQEVASPGVKD